MYVVREEYEETSSESDYMDCMTLAQPDSISAVKHSGDVKEFMQK